MSEAPSSINAILEANGKPIGYWLVVGELACPFGIPREKSSLHISRGIKLAFLVLCV